MGCGMAVCLVDGLCGPLTLVGLCRCESGARARRGRLIGGSLSKIIPSGVWRCAIQGLCYGCGESHDHTRVETACRPVHGLCVTPSMHGCVLKVLSRSLVRGPPGGGWLS